MDKLKQIIRSKPRWITFVIFAYIVILGILKWRMTPDIGTVYYLVGGLVGIYFMDIAIMLFGVTSAPFTSIIFIILFSVVSFFVVTSSGSMFAIGMVLSLYVSILLTAAQDWQEHGNLDTWYELIQSPPSKKTQQWIVFLMALILVVETILFIT